VPVSATDSPLNALKTGLAAQGIEADLSVVYAVYDEAGPARRIVFRGHVNAPPPRLTACPIAELETLPVPDPALQALLARFSQEHRLQDFGLYIGNAQRGDVVPDNRRG
jgi:flavin-dependent trigonelline monooxygenase, reductase component